MRAFRGTLIALLVLLVLGGVYWALRPAETTGTAKRKPTQEEGVKLFPFEKSELVRVEVKRPDATLVLVEKPDAWYLEGQDLKASRSMVNRVKHQLHDLVSRATVVEEPEALALYGLGEGAIHVTLTFRDGRTVTFDAGDPNPSGVSFYIRPTPGDTVYTVKKSAVDYYALSLDEFRERRFASFDSKDVDALEARRADGVTLTFQRIGAHDWELLSPERFAADDGKVRSLMGRVSALKAIRFVSDDASDLAAYGLAAPRLAVTLKFSGREPLTLLVGAPTGDSDGSYPLTYAKLADEPTVYAVRDGLLEDYQAEPASFRLTRFMRMDPNRVTRIVATWDARGEDADLNGTVTVRMAADTWLWDDGVPVPGSTPKRVASRAADVDARAFHAAQADDAALGFDRPRLTLTLSDLDGVTRTLVVGEAAPAGTDPDGNAQERWFARVREAPEAYVIDGGVVEVAKDLLREHRRKAKGDAEDAVRHERIEEELAPGPKPPIPDRLGPPGRRPRPGDPPPTE